MTSKSSGKTYYRNKATGASQWQHPVTSAPPVLPAASLSPAATDSLPAGAGYPALPAGIEAVLRNKNLVANDETLAKSCASAQEELNLLRTYAQTLAHAVKDEKVASDLSKMSDLIKQSSKEIGDLLQAESTPVAVMSLINAEAGQGRLAAAD
jgi:hypothetical protein